MAKSVDFNEMEMVNDDVVDVQESSTPKIGDIGWTDHVLSLLSKNELDHDNPTVHGLRRIVEVVFGEVINSGVTVLQVPEKSNDYIATVMCTLDIQKHDGSLATFSGVADAGLHNIDPGFKKYPVAMAETRAEGRALRKALRLKVVAAEEISTNADPVQMRDENPNIINSAQKQMIQSMANRVEVNLESYLTKTFAGEYNSIDSISFDDAKKIIRELDSFQKDSSLIDDSIKLGSK